MGGFGGGNGGAPMDVRPNMGAPMPPPMGHKPFILGRDPTLMGQPLGFAQHPPDLNHHQPNGMHGNGHGNQLGTAGDVMPSKQSPDEALHDLNALPFAHKEKKDGAMKNHHGKHALSKRKHRNPEDSTTDSEDEEERKRLAKQKKKREKRKRQRERKRQRRNEQKQQPKPVLGLLSNAIIGGLNGVNKALTPSVQASDSGYEDDDDFSSESASQEHRRRGKGKGKRGKRGNGKGKRGKRGRVQIGNGGVEVGFGF